MKRIPRGYVHPSSALTLPSRLVHSFEWNDAPPVVGDVVYGEITRIGQHDQLENRSGRIHRVQPGSKGIFVFGNRYATDAFEAVVPDETHRTVDLIARSGVIGSVRVRNSRAADPTRVRIHGKVYTADSVPVNTLDHGMTPAKRRLKKLPRSSLILVVGTSMNSGKSTASVACCWALSSMGHNVRSSKATGTASLKEILHMNDAGASIYNDFTYLGYPSTYLLSESEVITIFDELDLKIANNPKNYWIVEIADGILQRETAMLLRSENLQSRIHRLILCASDPFAALGGLRALKEEYELVPDAISGLASGSPLGIQEIARHTDIPVFNSVDRDLQQLAAILI